MGRRRAPNATRIFRIPVEISLGLPSPTDRESPSRESSANPRNPRSTTFFINDCRVLSQARIRPRESICEDPHESFARLIRKDDLVMRDHQPNETPGNQQLAPLLTLTEAADYLRLTPKAIYAQRHRGDKPGALGIRIGRKVVYRLSDIERFLDEQLAKAQVSVDQYD